MLTLQASELMKHEEDNIFENHQNNNDLNINDWHSPPAMHDLYDGIDGSHNNNTKLPSYHDSNLNISSKHDSIRNLSYSGDNPEAIQVEDCEEDEERENRRHEVYYNEAHYNEEEAGEAEAEEEEDEEEDIEAEENIISQMGGWINGMPVDRIFHETSSGHVLPCLDKANFGEINIKKSANVRVGNTTLYKGPVTIKQFVYTNSQLVHENGDVPNGGISDLNSNDMSIVKDGSTAPIFPVHREYNIVKEWLWTWRCAAILCVTALTVVTTVVVISTTLSQHSGFPPLAPAIDPDDILYEGVRFIKRTEWGAQPPEGELDKLEVVPTPYVIISHTASEPCNSQAECVQRVRIAQMMHIENNGWSDIGYNFLVGGDGQVYIGRGWDTTGAHSFGFNSKSIGISFIGTFNKIIPPARQLHALQKLIEIGVKDEKIADGYKLLGHRQVSETLSPGDVLYSIIKTMDHWSEKP